MSFEMEWEQRGVVIRFFGVVTIRDIFSASNAYQGDGRFDGITYVLADYSKITDCDAEPQEIDIVWAVDKGAAYTNPNIRKAIVATNPKVKALRERYQSALYHDSAYPTRVFTSEEAARAWLGTVTSQPLP